MSQIEIFHSGDEYFDALLKQIQNSQKSIWINVYIFSIDPLTEKIIQSLKEAKSRGVDVRILVDGFGSLSWISRLREQFQKSQIEFRVFKPFPSDITSFLLYLYRHRFRVFRILQRINRRDHRKITIIDEQILFMGSFNFISYHCEKFLGKLAWRDTGIMVSGEDLSIIKSVFHFVWNEIKFPYFFHLRPQFFKEPYLPQKNVFRLNIFRHWRKDLLNDLIQKIKLAENHILITSAYFLPQRRIVKELIRASQRGVTVEVIFPGPTDVPIVKWGASALAYRLARVGVQLWQYQIRVLHAKYLIIDSIAIIGSQNLNHRSLIHDLETDFLLTDPTSVRNIQEQWHKDQKNSSPYSAEIYHNYSIVKKIFCWFIYQFRYWL